MRKGVCTHVYAPNYYFFSNPSKCLKKVSKFRHGMQYTSSKGGKHVWYINYYTYIRMDFWNGSIFLGRLAYLHFKHRICWHRDQEGQPYFLCPRQHRGRRPPVVLRLHLDVGRRHLGHSDVALSGKGHLKFLFQDIQFTKYLRSKYGTATVEAVH